MVVPACATGTEVFNTGEFAFHGQTTTNTYQRNARVLDVACNFTQDLVDQQHPSTGPTFRHRLWFSSGRSPTAVAEVLVWDHAGDFVNGTRFLATVLFPVFLPSVGRNWAPETDSIIVTRTGGWTQPEGGLCETSWVACTGQPASTDCCAETLSKLDQLIGYVSKVFPPLV